MLHYEVHGAGPALVLIHGLGSSMRDWEFQVDYFARGFRLITIDLHGHGKSPKPRGRYSISMFAQGVAEVIDNVGDPPVHVLGLSLGGMVAFELAVSRPELVKSLVIVNSAPETPRDTLRDRLLVWVALLSRWLVVRLLGMRRLGAALAAKLFPQPGQQELRRTFTSRWAENDKRAYLSSMWAIRRWSVADRLGSIACPTCVIAAEMDYTPVSLKRSYAAKMPRAEVVVLSGSRHFTPRDQPERFNRVVQDFLTKDAR
jgi:3-oxoadipate enol-lactonase